MRAANVIAGISFVLWAALAWLGASLIKGVADQHAPGYPNWAQISYYLGFPATVAAAIALCIFLFNRRRGSAMTLGVVAAVSLVPLLPFLFGYTGGV